MPVICIDCAITENMTDKSPLVFIVGLSQRYPGLLTHTSGVKPLPLNMPSS